MLSRIDREDFEFLKRSARLLRGVDFHSFVHIDQPIGWWSYIRIANDIKSQIGGGRILDWGCGLGQMTYLLRRRGFEVVPFDVGPPDSTLPPIPLSDHLEIIRTLDETQLPFADGSFDAVLGCGVLEHVEEGSDAGSEKSSLHEIHRVLRPGGNFLIYHLPQEMSWQEALLRKLGRGYTHPRRFSERQIRTLLEECGFSVPRVRRSNLIPRNLTGVPERVRRIYSMGALPLIWMDRVLCRVSGLNRLAGVLEVTAVAEDQT